MQGSTRSPKAVFRPFFRDFLIFGHFGLALCVVLGNFRLSFAQMAIDAVDRFVGRW